MRANSLRERLVVFTPSNIILPALGTINLARHFRSVVFPTPFGPAMAVRRPLLKEQVMSFNTGLSAYAKYK